MKNWDITREATDAMLNETNNNEEEDLDTMLENLAKSLDDLDESIKERTEEQRFINEELRKTCEELEGLRALHQQLFADGLARVEDMKKQAQKNEDIQLPLIPETEYALEWMEEK